MQWMCRLSHRQKRSNSMVLPVSTVTPMGWEYRRRQLMRALPFIAAALAGCASVPAGPPPPPPEQSFREVKSVALVHRVGWRGAEPGPGETRRRDPLDALQGALAERGVKTVTIELTDRPPPPDLAEVEALARSVEWSAQDATPDATGPIVGSVGARAAPPLAKLGVEAMAVYVRGPGWGTRRSSPFFGEPLMRPPPPPVAAPTIFKS